MNATDTNTAIFFDLAQHADGAVTGSEHVASVREVIEWYAANPAEEPPCDDCATFIAFIDSRAAELAAVIDMAR